MVDFQLWLMRALASVTPVSRFMHTKWGWPIAESIHFIGLSLLVGTIFLLDLRLLGLAKRIPIDALQRFVPWGLFGFALSLVSGIPFLMTEPDQYIFNPAFHFKVLFMLIAGANASVFYLVPFRRITSSGAVVEEAPRSAKIIATVSIVMWISVIIAGRLLTFYRPFPCGPEGPGFLSTCLPNYRSVLR
jgi:hypothetical protein